MPDTLLDSGSVFDRTKIELGQWLRETLGSARALGRADLDAYKFEHNFAAGWAIDIDHAGITLLMEVLLDRSFPYSPIRVALKGADHYLKWPHVEPGGLLCLPRLAPPAVDLKEVARETLLAAIGLYDQCQDPAFVTEELRREFISYWNRSDDPKGKRFRSLLDVNDHSARQIAVWYGESYTLVGESAHQLKKWLANIGFDGTPKIAAGLFGYLNHAPVLPFPDSPTAICHLMETECPAAASLLVACPLDRDVPIVLAAELPTGVGLIAMRLSPPRKLKGGFRANPPPAAKLMIWKMHGQLTRCEVDRYDAVWIYGRGLNKDLPRLQAATVLILGCGSLGSQVAMRLAQAGVGGLVLVDMDSLSTANVGRHALGIDAVGRFKDGKWKYKSSELAKVLRRRFPHMQRVEAFADNWQTVLTKRPEIFQEATLIISCLGEWGADGQLGEWHNRSGVGAPILYGWLDEFGTASHGVLLGSTGPALGCVLGPDGDLRVPETIWSGSGLVQAEPACGTLFQPYGPLDVAHAETLVVRLAIDYLAGTVTPPLHRIYAGPSKQIVDAGGEWSDEHKKHRPAGYDGPFEYAREIRPCGECSACLGEG